MKYLGIIIEDRLRFKDHYDYKLKKIVKENPRKKVLLVSPLVSLLVSLVIMQ